MHSNWDNPTYEAIIRLRHAAGCQSPPRVDRRLEIRAADLTHLGFERATVPNRRGHVGAWLFGVPERTARCVVQSLPAVLSKQKLGKSYPSPANDLLMDQSGSDAGICLTVCAQSGMSRSGSELMANRRSARFSALPRALFV